MPSHRGAAARTVRRPPAGLTRQGRSHGVAAEIRDGGTTIILLGGQRAIAFRDTSDATAWAAHDLEVLMGEGPVHALTRNGTTIRLAGPALRDRWPRYGPAVTELGVQAVLAVPLPGAGSLGALCACSQQPAITDHAAAVAGRIATAAARALLRVAPYASQPGGLALPLLGMADDQVVVHQAADMVSAQCHCSIPDALALLSARAFASGQPVGQVAAAVVHDRLRLD